MFHVKHRLSTRLHSTIGSSKQYQQKPAWLTWSTYDTHAMLQARKRAFLTS